MINRRVLLSFAFGLLLIAPSPSMAGIVVQVTTDNDTQFTFSITGGPITQTTVTTITPYFGKWSLLGTITETEKPQITDPNDKVALDLTVQHIVNPAGHSDPASGNPLLIRLSVDADNATGSPASITATLGALSAAHGSHTDFVQLGVLTAQVQHSLPFDDDITSWKADFNILHSVPEPSTIGMGCTAALILSGYLLRRRRSST